MPARTNPQTEAQIVDLLKLDLTFAEIEAKTGINRSTVGHVARRFGYHRGKGNVWKTRHQTDLIAQLYVSGMNCREIEAVVGIDREHVRRRLHRRGVEVRKRGLMSTNNPQWKHGQSALYRAAGYRARKVVRQVTGMQLPKGWVVHHQNENNKDNQPANLVIFPDVSNHAAYHQRQLENLRAGSPAAAIHLVLKNDGLPLLTLANHLLLLPDTDRLHLFDRQDWPVLVRTASALHSPE